MPETFLRVLVAGEAGECWARLAALMQAIRDELANRGTEHG